MKHTITCIAAAFFLVSSAWADEVEIPNVFQSGTPAIAADVNENFDALEAAVDDNAQDIAAMEAGNAINVKLDGAVIGRFVSAGRPQVPVDVAAMAGGGTVLVGEATSLVNSNVINVMSAIGYRFSIWTSDFSEARFSEGVLMPAPVFYDQASCQGNTWFPVEGNTGFFTRFDVGDGNTRPAKRWAFRQGSFFASPDPDDVNPGYMIRRGQTAQVRPLMSFLFWSDFEGGPLCLDVADILGFDVNDPNHVNHDVFALEPLDGAETGIGDRLGGAITVGL